MTEMKHNILKITTLLLALAALAGCDIEPVFYKQVAPDTFYDSKDAVWQRYYRSFTHARWTFAQDGSPFALQELTTDEFISPVRGGQNASRGEDYKMHYHDFPIYFGASYQVYASRMVGVARCWAALDDLRDVDLASFGFPEGTWENWTAQLTALAGLNYLEGLDCFGGLPLYAESAEEERPRSTAKETFNFIEKLFNEAMPNLEAKTALGAEEKGEIHKAMAALGLAKLYFNAVSYIGEERYEDAARICQDLIDGKYGAYELDKDWTKIFGFENAWSNEIIWSIPSERAQLETDAYYEWGRQMPTNMSNYFGGIPNSNGSNQYCLTPSLDGNGQPYTYKLGSPFSKFEDTDMRKRKYRYLGNGKYEGMFLFGELVNPDNSSWKVIGTQEYSGQTLRLVDQVARLSEGKKESSMETGEENSGVRLVKFSPRPNANDANLLFNPDIPIMRLTEAYYILAECKWRSGDRKGAADLINEVRKRYFENGNDPNKATAENLDQWRMLDEWMIEFIGENRRRTDLIRWNQYITGEWWDHTPDGATNAHKKLFPISTHILNVSDVIKQNPGYSDK